MERVPSPGELLRAELERRGWSQSKLALLCDVSMTTINRVISNRRGITPRLDAQLHRVLGSEPGYWLACNQRYRRSLAERRCSRWLPVLLAALLWFGLPVSPVAAAAAAPQRWDLRDGAGQGWGLVLFSQPDPAYPPGWRLRLTARTGGIALDHQQPLQLDDGLGQQWLLQNRSAELVSPGEGPLPLQSAQFDLESLQPRPSEALPLHLRVPLEDGEAELVLGPDQLTALHALPTAAS